MLRVNQTGKRDGVVSKIGLRTLSRVIEYGDDLYTLSGELVVLIRQLTEVPATERSLEAA
jgi:hypothetical protein